jgi:hypothetical protein
VTGGAFLARGRDAGPITVEGGFGVAPAGLYGAPGTVPTQSWNNSNYYVDPVFTFTDLSPLVVTAQAPVPGEVSVPLNAPLRVTFSKSASSIDFAVTDEAGTRAPGVVSYDAPTRTATFTPSAPWAGFATYSVVVTAQSAEGTALSAGGTWSFRTVRPPSTTCPCGLYEDTVVPDITAANDNNAVVLGMRFSPSVDGKVVGMQFWKSTQLQGPFATTLWGPAGQVLAQATVSNSVPQGWQDVAFDVPVDVTAGQEYTVSYRAPTGKYPATLGALGAARTVGDLRTPENAGVYVYGSGRPTTTTSTSYLVDVQFQPAPVAPVVVSRTPSAGAVDVPVGTDVSVTVSQPLATAGTTLTLTRPDGQAVSGTLSVNDATATLALPDLLPGTTYTAKFTGKTTDGSSVGPTSWSFTTKALDGQCPCLIFGGDVPPIAATDDGAAVELGTQFSANRNGVVGAVRFYGGAGNTGPHTVSVWSADGTRLATAQAPSGEGEGWQTVQLPEPVAITAGTMYVVSYFAPKGHYSAGHGYFAEPRTVGPLTAPANAGRYLYGGGFPQHSWQSGGYWVDPVFTDG